MSKDWLHGGQQLTSHCNIYTKAVRLQVKDGAKKNIRCAFGTRDKGLDHIDSGFVDTQKY
jgi:hypothetical protein